MGFLRRWRFASERQQEQLLVRLWTINNMNADADDQFARPASKLAFDANTELRSSLKHLSGLEVARTVAEAADENQIASRLRKHLRDGYRDE